MKIEEKALNMKGRFWEGGTEGIKKKNGNSATCEKKKRQSKPLRRKQGPGG